MHWEGHWECGETAVEICNSCVAAWASLSWAGGHFCEDQGAGNEGCKDFLSSAFLLRICTWRLVRSNRIDGSAQQTSFFGAGGHVLFSALVHFFVAGVCSCLWGWINWTSGAGDFLLFVKETWVASMPVFWCLSRRFRRHWDMLSCEFNYPGRLLETKQKMGIATLITEACTENSRRNTQKCKLQSNMALFLLGSCLNVFCMFLEIPELWLCLLLMLNRGYKMTVYGVKIK